MWTFLYSSIMFLKFEVRFCFVYGLEHIAQLFSVFNLRHKHIIFTWQPYWCRARSLAYVKIQSDVGFFNTCQRKINEFDRSVREDQVKLMEMIAMSFLYC